MEKHTNESLLIDEYISKFPAPQQAQLQELRSLIIATIPEAKETISYSMPTYKWNGNVIHFAMNKKHIGIYPGSEAIKAFSNQLSEYKTSKGVIQLPLHHKIPKLLIQEIIHFNKLLLEAKTQPDWKKYDTQWSEAAEKMYHIVAQTPLETAFKWGGNIFTFSNKNVMSFGGFKHHFAVWFYNGVLLKDTQKHLISASDGKTKSLRQWRFTSAKDIDETLMLQYIKESIQLIKSGITLPKEKQVVDVNIQGLIQEQIEKDPNWAKAFIKLSLSKQKEYLQYIEEAKQEKTKISRLEKIIPLVLQGIGLNDKYKKH